ncbi:hypothetical protein TNIN_4811 [Trichonephila inaurata madagascariensis]|uniref:Uncharacterized protein n=1 Tax=Trichonephila inaurata madagascariensis TaxID=2747483 RepID=A0A8X6XAY3_9ARAC|nr:hypothetical protein TNIN_4811 [Trichonephila inaurata madagascariensis]
MPSRNSSILRSPMLSNRQKRGRNKIVIGQMDPRRHDGRIMGYKPSPHPFLNLLMVGDERPSSPQVWSEIIWWSVLPSSRSLKFFAERFETGGN